MILSIAFPDKIGQAAPHLSKSITPGQITNLYGGNFTFHAEAN